MLATEKQVSPATHRQALNALLFLYRQVLGTELPWMEHIGRRPERKRIPVVLTVQEVQTLLHQVRFGAALIVGFDAGHDFVEPGGLAWSDIPMSIPPALPKPLACGRFAAHTHPRPRKGSYQHGRQHAETMAWRRGQSLTTSSLVAARPVPCSATA